MAKLKTTAFEFTYTYLRKRYKAKGTMFKVVNHPQVYVAIGSNPMKSDVFTFYKIDEPDRMLYWFKHPGEKEGRAQALAKGIERYFIKQKAA